LQRIFEAQRLSIAIAKTEWKQWRLCAIDSFDLILMDVPDAEHEWPGSYSGDTKAGAVN